VKVQLLYIGHPVGRVDRLGFQPVNKFQLHTVLDQH